MSLSPQALLISIRSDHIDVFPVISHAVGTQGFGRIQLSNALPLAGSYRYAIIL
jgi:hypothetical protein